MKFSLGVLLLTATISAYAQAPTVSNITFDGISHSIVRATFSASAQFYWVRTRYIQSPGTCASGTGGSVQGSAYSNYNYGALHPGGGNSVLLGGLAPNTTYQVCPEISADSANWSSGAGATVTTLPAPANHPALPIPPTTFTTDYPDTSHYTTVTVASDCSDFMSNLTTAIQNQMSTGTVLQIPVGTVCTGPYNVYQRAPDVTVFPSSAVNTSANSINVNGHGFSEGQGIIFGTSYGCLPGSLTGLTGDCHQWGPIIAGQLYFVHVLDANNIQIYSGSSKNTGGTLCPLPDGGNGTEMFVHWPRPLKWIVVRTSTPDQQFTPEHVRTSPSWTPKMAVLQAPASAMGGMLASNTLMSVGDYDQNDDSMLANLRFVGLEFTYAVSPAAFTSSDPLPWYSLFATYQSDQNIIADRCYFHGLGSPNRVYNAVRWDGLNVAIIDSYLDNLEYFRSVYSGLGLTKVN